MGTTINVMTLFIHPSRLFAEGLRHILRDSRFKMTWFPVLPEKLPPKLSKSRREMLVVVGVVILALGISMPAFEVWESRKVQDAINLGDLTMVFSRKFQIYASTVAITDKSL